MIKALSGVEEQLTDKILNKYPEVLIEEPDKLQSYECRIRLKDDISIKIRPYPIQLGKQTVVETILKRMFDIGII